MSQRREVRVAPSFFDRLDWLLPEERLGDGTPSAADFLLHDLPPIIDRLAVDYEGATFEVPGAPGVRVVVTVGVLVPFIAVYTTVEFDDAVELLDLSLDRDR